MMRVLKSRMFKYGSNALLAVLIVLGILVVVNFLSNRHHRRFDTTESDVFSLSDQTVTLLENLNKDVRVAAFYREQDRAQFENLLKEYTYYSRHFSYRFVDPDKQPAEARRYKIRTYNTTVIESGEKEERITGSEERELTNAIAKAIREETKVIYFMTGHGEVSPQSAERDGYLRVREALLEANYEVRDTLLLARIRQVPEDCDLLVVAGPQAAFMEAEVDSIRSYLERGGAGVFLLDPGVQTGLEPMLAAWGIGVNEDFVVDNSGIGSMFGLDYSMPVASKYGPHPITEKHRGLMTTFMLARSVTRATGVPGAESVELVLTTPASWAETDSLPGRRSDRKIRFDEGKDRRGPVSLGMAVAAPLKQRDLAREGRRRTQIVVFGDSDFASNQFFTFQGNGDLLLNSVSWLLEEADRIAIRPKQQRFRPVRLTQQDGRLIWWLSLVVLPAIPVVAGVVVWWRRR